MKDYSLVWLRVLAMIFIFLCHILAFSSQSLISTSVNFFNVGIEIFLLISGYLYSKRRISKKFTFREWISKRYVRITLPVVLFSVFVVIVNLIFNEEIKLISIIGLIFNAEIVTPQLYGIHHLWFVSVIVICYVLVYITDVLRDRHNKRFIVVTTVSMLSIIVLIFVQIGNKDFVSYTIAVICFFAGYFIGGGIRRNSDGFTFLYMV